MAQGTKCQFSLNKNKYKEDSVLCISW